MRTEERFFRGPERMHEARTLAAPVYNLMRVLHAQHSDAALFVPIRSMQYLAVVDGEEVIFIDAFASRQRIVLAWQHFHPQVREALDEPIPFELVVYEAYAQSVVSRLQAEFFLALQQIQSRRPAPGDAVVVALPERH